MRDRAHRFEIPASLGGERLDRALALLTGRSRSQTAQMVADGSVRVDGTVADAGSLRLAPGAIVDIAPVAAAAPVSARVSAPLDVLHADSDIVVVNKPPGMITHRGSGHATGTLADALAAQFPEAAEVGQPDRPGIVHRLDGGTSGALVCARSARAYDSLVEQLAARRVRRIYAALARGHPSAPTGTVDAPIGRHHANRRLMAVSAQGRDARTHYRTVEVYTHPLEACLLRCRLETGRTHQIRVHLASIGLPLLGDASYGVADPFGIGRPLLHAARLSFEHPASGAQVCFDAPMPDDFVAALAGFGRREPASGLL